MHSKLLHFIFIRFARKDLPVVSQLSQEVVVQENTHTQEILFVESVQEVISVHQHPPHQSLVQMENIQHMEVALVQHVLQEISVHLLLLFRLVAQQGLIPQQHTH